MEDSHTAGKTDSAGVQHRNRALSLSVPVDLSRKPISARTYCKSILRIEVSKDGDITDSSDIARDSMTPPIPSAEEEEQSPP